MTSVVMLLKQGKSSDIVEYILVREGDVSAVDKLAAHLVDQGVEVKRATTAFSNGGNHYPSGSYIVPFAQPSYRLLRALLDPQVSMDANFLAEEEHRRVARQPSEMYDVTAWSLPLQYGIRTVGARQLSEGSFVSVPSGFTVPGKVDGAPAQLAYLVPWGPAAAGRFLASALQQNIRVTTADRSFVLNGHKYPTGTLIIQTKENAADLSSRVASIAAATGSQVQSTDVSWMEEGPNFGSRHNSYIPSGLRIAMAWDRPTSPGSAGAVRYMVEREFGYPVTAIRSQQLTAADLSQFKVILLPDTAGESYETIFGANGIRRLRDWVQNGGTLVALGPGATSFLASPRVNLLAVTQENVANPEDKNKVKPPAATPTGEAGMSSDSGRTPGKLLASEAAFEAEIRPKAELPDLLHGVLLRAKVDQNSWISAGVQPEVSVMVTGRTIFTPIKLDRGVNAVYFQAPDRILASGFMWEQNRKQLAYKPFVLVAREGRGNVVAFTADPNFRGYMDGLNILVLNAIFRGPAHLAFNGEQE